MDGFYVPGSVSSQYVASKRDDNGSLIYDKAASEIGIEKQAAVQQLEKNYATTIENAYASYLAANRGVMGSNMGQGYKELYQQLQQSQLQQNVSNITLDLASQRAALDSNEQSAQANLQNAFRQEVSNFDRTQKSFADYLEYTRTLSDTNGNLLVSDELYNRGVDSLYDYLHNLQPQGFANENGDTGLTYEQWMRKNFNNTEADNTYSQWLFGGGLSEFMSAPKATQYYNAVREAEEQVAREAEEQAAREAEEQVAREAEIDKSGVGASKLPTAAYSNAHNASTDALLKKIPNISLADTNVYRSSDKTLSIKFRSSRLDTSTVKWLKENGFREVLSTASVHTNVQGHTFMYELKTNSKEELEATYKKILMEN